MRLYPLFALILIFSFAALAESDDGGTTNQSTQFSIDGSRASKAEGSSSLEYLGADFLRGKFAFPAVMEETPANPDPKISLDATLVGWFDTNIDIDPNSNISFTATQQVQYPGRDDIFPDGVVKDSVCKLVTGFPFAALIGKMGSAGTPFLIGADQSLEPSQVPGGRLFLAINASLNTTCVRGSSGSFKVSVIVSPAWYPVTYPKPGEMAPESTVKPRLYVNLLSGGTTVKRAPLWEIRQKMTDGICVPLPTPIFQNSPPSECLAGQKEYAIDSTGLASLEKFPDSTKEQSAVVMVADVTKLQSSKRDQMMSQPGFLVPNDPAILVPTVAKVKNYVPHVQHPLALGGVNLQLGKTIFQVPVGLPPAPTCYVKRLTSGPVYENTSVRFALQVDSIVRSASVAYPGFELEFDLSNLSQSAESIGVFTTIQEFELNAKIPDGAHASPDGTYPWDVTGEVMGVRSDLEPFRCVLEVPVTKPPPPNCNLTAINPSIVGGETTNLKLDCSLRGSGPVTEATVNGVALTAAQIASLNLPGNRTVIGMPYTRPNNLNQEVFAVVTGPGGTFNDSVLFGETCNLANVLQVYNPGTGRLFRRAYWDYGAITHEVVGRVQYGHRGGIDMTCASNRYCMQNMLTGRHRNHHVAEVGPKNKSNCALTRYFVRGNGCFSTKTRIQMADGESKSISKIVEGDWVWNPHYQLPVRVKKLVKGPERKPLYQVVIGKKRLEVTEDHPFFTKRGWVQAANLKVGESVFGAGKGAVVSKLTKMPYSGPQDVINLELDTNIPMGHVILAEGIPTGDLYSQIELKKSTKMVP